MTSTIRVAKHRQAQRDAGLTLLSRWVPLDIKPEADALIDRLIAEYDARKAVVG